MGRSSNGLTREHALVPFRGAEYVGCAIVTAVYGMGQLHACGGEAIMAKDKGDKSKGGKKK